LHDISGALGRSLLLGIWRPDASTYRLAEQAVKLGLAPAALKQAFLPRFQTASRNMCAAGRPLSAETVR
jgi:hypothetical protein